MQSKIDELYGETFNGVKIELAAQASTSRSAATEAASKERFDDLNEATFGLLGRQRPHVMKVCRLGH